MQSFSLGITSGGQERLGLGKINHTHTWTQEVVPESHVITFPIAESQSCLVQPFSEQDQESRGILYTA